MICSLNGRAPSAVPHERRPRTLPDRRPCETFQLVAGGLSYTCSFCRYSDGRLAEVFLQNHKTNSAADVNARDASIAFSIAVQEWRRRRGNPTGIVPGFARPSSQDRSRQLSTRSPRTRPMATEPGHNKTATSRKLDWLDALAVDPAVKPYAFKVGFAIVQHVNARTG